MVKPELLARFGFLNDKGKALFGEIKDDKVRKERIETYAGDINECVEQEKRELHPYGW